MEENLETLATYEPVGWENAEITKEATVTIDGIEYEVTPRIVSGKTPVNATNLSHMDDAIQENREAINDLYNGGATTSEIVIDTEEPPAEKEKIWINPDDIINNLGSEVVNTLDGNEKDKSPSVYAINKLNTYVSEKTQIGWYELNGEKKPRYRQEVTGTLGTTGTDNLGVLINTDLLIDIKGRIFSPSGYRIPINFYNGPESFVSCAISGSRELMLYYSDNFSGGTYRLMFEFVE